MATLTNKISSVYIRESGGAGWSYTFTTNRMDISLGQVNYNQATDEAIDGTLRSNIRGVRLEVTLDWQKLHNSTVSGSGSSVRAFLVDMIASIATNNDDGVEISFDNSNWEEVVPTGSTIRTAYNNQIGRGSANLEFKGRSIKTTIPDYLGAPSV